MINPTNGDTINSLQTGSTKHSRSSHCSRRILASLAASLLVGFVALAHPVHGQKTSESKELSAISTPRPDPLTRGNGRLNEPPRIGGREPSSDVTPTNRSSLIKQIVLSPLRLGRGIVSAIFHRDDKRSSSAKKPSDSGKLTPESKAGEVSSLPRQVSANQCRSMEYESRNQYDPPPLLIDILSGRAFDDLAQSGEATIELPAVDGACVGLFTEKKHQIVATTVTDSNGRFRFERIPDGLYRLVVSSDMFCVANVPIQITSKVSQNHREVAVHMRGLNYDDCSFGRYDDPQATSPRIKEPKPQ